MWWYWPSADYVALSEFVYDDFLNHKSYEIEEFKQWCDGVFIGTCKVADANRCQDRRKTDMEAIVSAFIGGAFTLIGVYWGHQLAARRESRREIKSEELLDNQPPKSKPISAPDFPIENRQHRPKNDTKVGICILIIDFIVLSFIVSIFDLNETDPAWENLFAGITLGVIPVYAIFKIFRGIFRPSK